MKTIIEETVDYDVFQKNKFNRPVDESLVIRLMSAIQKNNRLSSKPICVDEDFSIIDGQHRLEAAKRLRIPIYYVQEKYSADDMLSMNVNQKQWNLGDYLNFYSNIGGHPEYEKLKDFMKEHNLQISVALQVLNGERGSDFFKKFKDGQYLFPKDAEYEEAMQKKRMVDETIEYIKKKTTGNKGYLDKVAFYTALISFFNIKAFAYETFKKKLEMKLDLMRRCTCVPDYMNLFKEIYNFKNASPIKIEE